MPICRVKQPSDRGSIKNLVPREIEVADSELPPTRAELCFQKLYERAVIYRDTNLAQALGVITTEYIGDKSALPLSVYRLKEIVGDIKSRSGHEIERLEKQFAKHLSDPIDPELIDYLSLKKARVKTASHRKPPIFRRVSVE